MTDVCTAILSVIRDIFSIAEEVRRTNNQARRLLNRLLALEDPVRRIQSDKSTPPMASLHQTKTLLENSRGFLMMYKATSKITRIMKRYQHTITMVQLNVGLTEAVQSLQLSVAVERYKREDEEDESEDMSMMEECLERKFQQMEMHRQNDQRTMDENQADIMKALEGLRHDQKPEKGPRHEIDVKQLKVQTGGRSLGAGGFGAVQIGEWRGSRVAVKIIHSRGANRERMVRELRREAAVHQDLQYAFIAQLYGACTKGDNLGLVMELAPGGSLDEYLLNSSNPLDSALQIAFLYDIARGMSFLHEEGILHRDLKSANVLMFENSRLKLCDFGLAKVKEESSGRTGVGTAQWMAPELLMSERGSSSEQSDVYSFGIVCFEVAFREVPFAGRSQPQVIAIVTNRNARPTCIPPRSAVEGLMHHCWQATPCLRPNGFDPVVKRLANLMSVDGDPREIGAGPGDAHAPLPVNSPQGEAQNAGQHRSMEQRTWDQGSFSTNAHGLDRAVRNRIAVTGAAAGGKPASPNQRAPCAGFQAPAAGGTAPHAREITPHTGSRTPTSGGGALGARGQAPSEQGNTSFAQRAADHHRGMWRTATKDPNASQTPAVGPTLPRPASVSPLPLSRRNTGTTMHEMRDSVGSVSLGSSPSRNTLGPLQGESGGVVSKEMTESSGSHKHILTCTRHHGLECFVSASWSVICDRCHKKIPAGITRLYCGRCDFDVCVTCVASHMKLLTAAGCPLLAVDCRGRHVLEVHGIARCCNGCDRQSPLEDTTGFTCLRCNHDVCMRCVASCLKKLELGL